MFSKSILYSNDLFSFDFFFDLLHRFGVERCGVSYCVKNQFVVGCQVRLNERRILIVKQKRVSIRSYRADLG